MIKKYVVLIIVVIVVALFAGCHLDINNDVDYPADLFKQKLKKIDTLTAKATKMKGQVNNLNILVYDGEDRELIDFSVPFTAAKESAKWAMNVDNFDKKDKVKKISKKLGNIELDNLDFLEKLRPGLIAEIEVNEPKEKAHILIWLD